MTNVQREYSFSKKAALSQNILDQEAEYFPRGKYDTFGLVPDRETHGTCIVSPVNRGAMCEPVDVCALNGIYIYNALVNGAARMNLQLYFVGSTQEPVSVADMIGEIKSVFGLSVVQISDVLGISRPAVYNHVAGDVPADTSSYEALYKAASRVHAIVHRPLKPGLKSILVGGKSLLRHIKESYRDTDKIEEVAKLVAEKLDAVQPSPKAQSIPEQRRAIAMVGKSG